MSYLFYIFKKRKRKLLLKLEGEKNETRRSKTSCLPEEGGEKGTKHHTTRTILPILENKRLRNIFYVTHVIISVFFLISC